MIMELDEGESFVLQPNLKPLKIEVIEIYGSVKLLIKEAEE